MPRYDRFKETYDFMAKKLLSLKVVIANYLKYLLPEYKDLDIMDIIDCIEDSNNEYVKGLPTINESDKHGKVIYDVYFKIKNPISDETMYINIEPQYDDSKYDILKRSEYYLSGILYKQKNEDFFNSNYDNIKKIYSIWLVFSPKEKHNCIINNINPYKRFEYNEDSGTYINNSNYNHDTVSNTFVINLDLINNYNHKGVFELSALLFKYNNLDIDYRYQKLNVNPK